MSQSLSPGNCELTIANCKLNQQFALVNLQFAIAGAIKIFLQYFTATSALSHITA